MNKGPVTKEKIIRQVAADMNLAYEEVERIVESQFQFVADTMAEGNFEAVRLPLFGLFHAKEERIKYLKKYGHR